MKNYWKIRKENGKEKCIKAYSMGQAGRNIT